MLTSIEPHVPPRSQYLSVTVNDFTDVTTGRNESDDSSKLRGRELRSDEIQTEGEKTTCP